MELNGIILFWVKKERLIWNCLLFFFIYCSVIGVIWKSYFFICCFFWCVGVLCCVVRYLILVLLFLRVKCGIINLVVFGLEDIWKWSLDGVGK